MTFSARVQSNNPELVDVAGSLKNNGVPQSFLCVHLRELTSAKGDWVSARGVFDLGGQRFCIYPRNQGAGNTTMPRIDQVYSEEKKPGLRLCGLI
jgi:hypothetical protein